MAQEKTTRKRTKKNGRSAQAKAGVKTARKAVKKTTKKTAKTAAKKTTIRRGAGIAKIRKRSGRLVPFEEKKIVVAVTGAFRETGEGTEKDARKVVAKVVSLLKKDFRGGEVPTVEDVQDMVERVLMILDFEETAKAYILYREEHRRIREMENALDNSTDLVDKYLQEMDWRVKENANMAYSLQGLNNYISSLVSSRYWMNKVYPLEVRRAHEEGDIHIHDLQLISAYCCGWDLQDLLRRGFTGVPGKISSGPAKHFSSILGQIVNFIYTLQGEVAGAEAFSNFDTLLAPFIRHDKLSYKQVKQEMQSFVFNMNISTRVGFQTPFSNLTMDITPPRMLAKEAVVIGGEPQKETYGEFQEEMNMLNRAFAEVMMEGDSNGRVFTFPIPTYNIGKDFDWEDKRFRPIWEMSAKYGIPYFANFVNSDMDPEDARSMCCRLRLDNRELHKRGGGLFGAAPLTGSVGVVTINLPRLGHTAESEKEFFAGLGELMDIAKESLEIKRRLVETMTERGLYPYSRFYLAPIKMRRGQYWANHFSTIGLIGMNEAITNLFDGTEDITTAKGQKFAEKTLSWMRRRIVGYQKKTGDLYNLEATPGEGTSYRLARMDQKKYKGIAFANDQAVREQDAEPYYTNSSQLPVGFTDDIFEALDLQDKLQTKYTGGTVLHGFLGERLWDVDATRHLIRRITEKYALPYFTLTPTFSVCPIHGYIAGEHHVCPQCVAEGSRKTLAVMKKGS